MKLLLLEPIDAEARMLLREAKICTIEPDISGRVPRYLCSEIDGVFTKLKEYTHFDVIFPNIKFVATPCTGTDHINIPDSVKLIHLDQTFKDTVGREILATAEHTWALLLSLIRKIPFAHNQTDRYKFTGTELRGKTIGIIGYGRIGRQVAKYASAFGMTVFFTDPNYENSIGDISIPAWHLDFEDLLQHSDIVTLHVPLSDETRGMIGEKEFEMMKDSVVLINTSRADVVDKDSVLDALWDNKISGYAVDFYDKIFEQFKGNVITTPHIAGNCVESRKKTDLYIAKQIIKFKEGMNG